MRGCVLSPRGRPRQGALPRPLDHSGFPGREVPGAGARCSSFWGASDGALEATEVHVFR